MATHNATPATLPAALKAAQTGDTIALAGGEYRGVKIIGATGLTITAQDLKHRPRILGGLTIRSAAGLRFAQVRFELGSIDVTSAGVVTLTGGSKVAFNDCDFLGHEREDGARFGRGLVASGVDGLDLRECRFNQVFRGAVIAGSVDVAVERNDFFDLGSDGLNLGQVARARVVGNQFVGFAPKAGDHPDGIQIMTTPTGGASEDVLIEGNLVACDAAGGAQGIFVKAENPAVRHRRIQVIDNALCNAGLNALSVGSTDDARISGNDCLFTPAPPTAKASSIRTQDTNGELSDNAAMGYIEPEGMLQSGNKTILAATAEEIAVRIAAWQAQWRPPPVIEITLQPGQRLIVNGAGA